MTTLTYRTDAYLTLDGDSVMFCTEVSRMADTALEIDLEVTGDEWNVTDRHRIIAPASNRFRKQRTSGE